MKELLSENKIERKALSLKEVAASLGVSYVSVWRRVARGEIRTVGGKRNRLIPVRELDRYLSTFSEEVK